MTPSEKRILEFIQAHPGEVPERTIKKELQLSHGCIFQTRKKLEALGLVRVERRGRCLVYYPAHFQPAEKSDPKPKLRASAKTAARMSDQRTIKKPSLSKWRTIKKRKMPVIQGAYENIGQWQYDIEAECGNVAIDYGFETATVTNLDTGDELHYSIEESDTEINVSCND